MRIRTRKVSSSAARECSISPSTISQSINKLRRSSDLRYFRKGRGVTAHFATPLRVNTSARGLEAFLALDIYR
ncbi:hypothetical protein LNQ52_00095 [Klebsiella pneumoniae subsp. pneumoniae]|nr:hypothetical protein [Klebsiella pneumoniae subsp. pneumoniae]